MKVVSCYEERPYQRVLFNFLDSHREDQLTVRATFPIYGLRLDYLVYDVSYYRIPSITKPSFWAEDADSESRIRTRKGFFMGWDACEFHDMAQKYRLIVYVAVPSSWNFMPLICRCPFRLLSHTTVGIT